MPSQTALSTPTFILASSSPRRRELLAGMGIDFVVLKPEVDETQRPGEAPLAYVERLSREKAQAAHARWQHGNSGRNVYPDAPTFLAADTVVVLAADTIGDLDGDILGKPADADEARAMLRRLRGRDHLVVTAVTLLRAVADQSPILLTRLTQTRVFMREYSDAEIEAYIATGDPFDKAGSYAIQHAGFHPVERIEGGETNVIGLPVETVRAMLAEVAIP